MCNRELCFMVDIATFEKSIPKEESKKFVRGFVRQPNISLAI